MKRLLALIATAVMVALCSACAPSVPALQVTSEEIAGGGTLGLSATGAAISGVVVYFHGMDQDAEVTRRDDKHKQLSENLLRAGFAVVSANAGGNAFGNPSSQQAYRELISAAQQKYKTDNVVFVAESMGALPALMLLADPQMAHVDAFAGITPAMGIPVGARSLNFVADAWGGVVPDSADPMSWPPDRLAKKHFRLYVGNQDNVIPPGATGEDFQERYGHDADVQVVSCYGGHVADTCFDGADLVRWLDGGAHR